MRLIFTSLLLFGFVRSFAQDLPPYNQYVFDPYLINPSYITHNGFSQLNLLYKAQWTGIDDAPKTSAINFQYIASPKISLGISAYNQDVVLLSTTSAMATFGYRVPFDRNNILAFGLSAGASMNRLKLEEIEDIGDPALFNASNSTRMEGQFGVNFTHKRLTLGFSLLRLLDNSPFDGGEFSDIEFSKLKNKAAIAGYRLSLGGDIEFSPYLLYRFTENFNYFEVTGMFSYKNKVTIGGFYRQDYGPGFVVRLRLSKAIDVGYSHEFASNQADDYLGGSHEIQFKMLFGENALDLLTRDERSGEVAAVQPVSPDTEEAPVVENLSDDEPPVETRAAEPEIIATKPVETESDDKSLRTDDVAATEETSATTPENATAVPIKYTLIVGTFSSASNAIAFIRTAREQGVRAEMLFDEASGYYYVFLPEHSTTEDVTVDDLLRLRQKIPYKDAWYKGGLQD